jgi:hypothetical protein
VSTENEISRRNRPYDYSAQLKPPKRELDPNTAWSIRLKIAATFALWTLTVIGIGWCILFAAGSYKAAQEGERQMKNMEGMLKMMGAPH